MEKTTENTAPIDDLLSELFTLKSAVEQREKTISENEKTIEENKKAITQKDIEINFLKEQLKLIKHNQYAKKSETTNSLQIEIPFEPQETPEEQSEAAEPEQETIPIRAQKRKVVAILIPANCHAKPLCMISLMMRNNVVAASKISFASVKISQKSWNIFRLH